MRLRRPLSGFLIVAVAAPMALGAQRGDGSSKVHAVGPVPFDVAHGNVYRGAFTPDGREFYFFLRSPTGVESYHVYFSARLAHSWSPPKRVDLGGDFSDLYPSISPDGQRMVFSSYRRAPGDTAAAPNATLWYSDRRGGTWSTPVPMTRASRPGQYNAGPQFERDGSISFSGGEPLVTRWNGSEYGEPQTDERVTKWIGWRKDLFVWSGTATPSGDDMILTASPVDSLTGRRMPADLWVTRKRGGTWSEPRPLGAGVNSERNDNFVFFSPDGRELYFVRDFGRVWHLPLARALGDTASVTSRVSSVPFDFEDGRVFVPVRVANDSVRWFILDTGAQPTILDASVASRLGIAVADAGRTTGAGTGSLRQGRAQSTSLRVGDIALGPAEVAVSELDSLLAPSQGRAAPGLIGSRFFMEHVVELDFGWPVMHVHDPKTYRYDGPGVVLPLRLNGGVPMIEGSLTAPDGAVFPMRLVVDLGAKSTLLVAEPFIRANGLGARFPTRVVSALGSGIGGETRYAFARAPRFTLGRSPALATDSIVVGLSVGGTLRSTWYDGLLGAEFLRRYRVIFDYSRERVILEAREPAVPPTEYDMSGMYLLASGPGLKRFVVRELVAGAPAAAAGVQVGDTILTVDGRSADRLTLSAVRRALRARDGRAVRLEIERDGARTVLTVTLRRLV